MNKSGIYKITNIETQQVYVGSSSNLSVRKTQHFNKLRTNSHVNRKLQNSWNKYGEENFVFSIILLCETENLSVKEQDYIDSLSAFETGFNLVKLAGVGTYGYKHTEESKLKMSIAKTGSRLPRTQEHQDKLSKAQIGRVVSAETREKIAASLRGKKLSEETKGKLKIAAKTKSRPPATDEAKKNMSLAQKKRYHQEGANGLRKLNELNKYREITL